MSGNAEAREDLLSAYRAALQAVGGRPCVRKALNAELAGASWLGGEVAAIAVGKAAAHMMAGAFDALGSRIRRALVVTKHGHTEFLWPADASVRTLESAHPRPDGSSLVAGEALVEFLADDQGEAGVLCLVSGGASSLVESLAPGLDEQTLSRVGEWVLACGLPIAAVNRVRKRLSRIKAGRLAALLGSRRALHLMISDVPGDDPRIIGSGLLVAHAQSDIAVADLDLPPWLAALAAAAPALAPEDAFAQVDTRVIARPADALGAATAVLEQRGYRVLAHDGLLQGEAVVAGRELARSVLAGEPGCQVWVGETTVTLPASPGRGGRCQALALAAASEFAGNAGAMLLAAGTDGSDGPGADAGALVDGGTIARGRRAGFDPDDCLARADAGTFLDAAGALLRTGPTGTNVMDLMIGLRVADGAGS